MINEKDDWFGEVDEDSDDSSDEIPGLKANQIQEMLQNARRTAKIKLKQAVRRNIIFVGKSRVGKTTAMNVLKDPTNLVKDMSIFADTMEPALYSFTVEVKITKENVREALKKVLKEDRMREKKEQKQLNNRNQKLNAKSIKFPPGVHVNLAEVQDKVKQKEVKVDNFDDEVGDLEELNFNINIIDTPGLFERRRIGEDVRGNETLKKTIIKCLDNEIPSIHCIFFVLSVADGINEQDLLAFQEFLELFSGAESVIAMLFTRTENFKAEQKDKIIEELKQYDKFAPLIKKVDNRIFFTGSAKFEDFENQLPHSMSKTINSVENARNSLLKFILLNSKPCHIRHFKIIQEEAKLVENKLNTLQDLFSEYGNANKEEKIKLKISIDEHLHYVAKNSHIIPASAYNLLNNVEEKVQKYFES